MRLHNVQYFLEMEIEERVDSEEEPATEEDTVTDLDNRVLNGFQGSLTETGDLIAPGVSLTSASATAPHLTRWSRRSQDAVMLLLIISLVML